MKRYPPFACPLPSCRACSASAGRPTTAKARGPGLSSPSSHSPLVLSRFDDCVDRNPHMETTRPSESSTDSEPKLANHRMRPIPAS
jgi:hypothetical protein